MRMTRLLLKTQKQVATEAELPSHQLTLRAGLARRLAAGIYTLTPLAYRVVRKIEQIVRDEMDAIGGQEVLMPVVQPAELWQESGRYGAIDAEMARLRDRSDRELVLAMTHEEAVTDLIRANVSSYRDLPLMVYQVQTKFRDEARPRAGLIRLREFLMKDAYSFHTSQADLDAYYEQVLAAYQAIFRRAGVNVLVVQSDSGMMGGKVAHEFMCLADGGEDTLLVCPDCDHAANVEVATAHKGAALSTDLAPATLQLVHTPGAATIAQLVSFLGVAATQILKSVFYAAGDELVLALIRGDLEVNAVKLRNLLGQEVRSLSAGEAATLGLTVGFAGPVGLQLAGKVRLVADDSIVGVANLVAGANQAEYHLTGVNHGRDFRADLVGDIAVATAGQGCPQCGAALTTRRGIEAGNIFKLGTKYSAAMGATFTDEAGGVQPIIMGCYGVGITRLLACILEENHDPDGIIWPVGVAPYAYHLLVAGKDAALTQAAAEIYGQLSGQALFDDRDLSTGVKFKDADLLGMPLRITVSSRSLAAGGAELRLRRTGETRVVPLADVAHVAAEMVAALA